VKSYFAICAMYRDEAPYLREWVEFHRLVGAERFFLYNNRSIDAHREVLAPYIADGTVVLYEWPEPILPNGQANAWNHCIATHRTDARWMAFLDIDGFLLSPTGQKVSEVLTEYEPWPGVGVHWLNFGNSGHRTKPPGLVIENYLHRAEDPWIRKVRCIIDPTRVERALSPLHFSFRDGYAVDENRQPLEEALSISRSYSKLRINHYARKSDEELARDTERWAVQGLQRGAKKSAAAKARRARELNELRDETILVYLPALREALAETP
jgi:hypothetical protein